MNMVSYWSKWVMNIASIIYIDNKMGITDDTIVDDIPF
jgi:hypothetical protein